MSYGPVSLGAVRWWIHEGHDRAVVEPVLERAVSDWRSGSARCLKSGRRKSLYRIEPDGDGGRAFLLKVHRRRGGWRPRLHPPRALQELRLAEEASRRGIATPVPWAAGSARDDGALEASLLLVPVLEGVVDLGRAWTAETTTPRERRALACAAGRLVRRAHDAGLLQADLMPNNILVRVGPEPVLWLIDFERAGFRTRIGRRARLDMLAKLERGMRRPRLAHRLRFLSAYGPVDAAAPEAPGTRRRDWHELGHSARRLARRDRRRLEADAIRAGRAYRTIEAGTRRGIARAGTPAGLVEKHLSGSIPGPGELWPSDDGAVWILGLRRPPDAGRSWATSIALADRGLAPWPLGLAIASDAATIVWARDPGTHRLDPAGPHDTTPGVRTLLRRLEGYGRFVPADGVRGPVAIGAGPCGTQRAWLVGVESFRMGRS